MECKGGMCALLLATLSAAFVAGCAGSGEGLDTSGRPLSEGGGSGQPLTATFDSIQQNVFTPICTACHAGAAAPQGLRLDAANSYALLVGVASSESRSVLRVKPGDPDNSYLVQKLEGRAAVGAQMPLGGPALPAATIAVIRQWITDGARRSTATADAGVFRAKTAIPARGDVMSAPVSRIVVEFSGELDQTRIDETSLRLEATGGVDIPVSVMVSDTSARVLVVEPSSPLRVGRYRVVARGEPATGISSVAGERLGGDNAADTLVTEFSVEAEQ